MATSKTISPSKLAHVVFRTHDFDEMKNFYVQFLGARVAVEVPNTIVFLRYDEEHHRLGIIGMPDIGDKVKHSNGIEHVAFTFSTLSDLIEAYKQRKALGMEPFWCVNHGPTTSMYYHDPDGNILETQYDNLDTDTADAFITSDAYRVNPIGVDFDPKQLITRLESGEPLEELIKRPESGPRGVDSVPE